jgi:hypothetical protein
MYEVGKDRELQPTPVLDVRVSGGQGGRRWSIRCRTCGWEISGDADAALDNEAAKSHRCTSSAND